MHCNAGTASFDDDIRAPKPVKSALYLSGDIDPVQYDSAVDNEGPFLMADDPRLTPMPAAPTLFDFFRCRFSGHFATHLLQSARNARLAGHDDKIVLACLLHDISVIGFIRADHGYWAAQLVAPYVDEEVRWAIEKHQVLRFFPDESVGYSYPPEYVSYFGPDFMPSAFVRDEYERARQHRYYMSARLVTLHDTYTFDQAPPADLGLDEFEDIVGRHFRQPKEGLGFDGSASAHMWRTIMQPTRFL